MFLIYSIATTLVQTTIISCLDYCKSLLTGFSASALERQQSKKTQGKNQESK